MPVGGEPAAKDTVALANALKLFHGRVDRYVVEPLVSAQDWSRVHELALAIAKTSDPDQGSRHRQALFAFIQELIWRYGELPSLLATQADYVTDRRESERLLLRAFDRATSIADDKNSLYIALSLAELYADELQEPSKAASWLVTARAHLNAGDESDWEEYRRIAGGIRS